MGSQRTIDKYNLEYFHEDLVAGDYDMPTIYPTVYRPKQLIGFNYLNAAKSDMGIHFYLEGGTRSLTKGERNIVDKVRKAWDNYGKEK